MSFKCNFLVNSSYWTPCKLPSLSSQTHNFHRAIVLLILAFGLLALDLGSSENHLVKGHKGQSTSVAYLLLATTFENCLFYSQSSSKLAQYLDYFFSYQFLTMSSNLNIYVIETIHKRQDCRGPFYYLLQELNHHQYSKAQKSSHSLYNEININWGMKTFASKCMPMTGNMQIAALENGKTS